MAVQVGSKGRAVKTTATGDQEATGMPKSIPPTKPVTPMPPSFQKDFTFGRQSYGSNAYGGASSDTPGNRTRASISVNGDDTDPVLRAIRLGGTAAKRGAAELTGDDVRDVKAVTSSEVRTVDAKPFPLAHGMRSRDGE